MKPLLGIGNGNMRQNQPVCTHVARQRNCAATAQARRLRGKRRLREVAGRVGFEYAVAVRNQPGGTNREIRAFVKQSAGKKWPVPNVPKSNQLVRLKSPAKKMTSRWMSMWSRSASFTSDTVNSAMRRSKFE